MFNELTTIYVCTNEELYNHPIAILRTEEYCFYSNFLLVDNRMISLIIVYNTTQHLRSRTETLLPRAVVKIPSPLTRDRYRKGPKAVWLLDDEHFAASMVTIWKIQNYSFGSKMSCCKELNLPRKGL